MLNPRLTLFVLACCLAPIGTRAQDLPHPSPEPAPAPVTDVAPDPSLESATAPLAPPAAVAPPPAPAVAPSPPPAAEPALEPAPSAEAPPEPEAAEPDYPIVGLDARVMTGFELEREHPEGNQPSGDTTQAELFLEQAVIEAEAEISKRIDLELGFNLRNQTIRDAFVNYRVEDAFQLRVGRFKRPFSRLELRSRGKLPFRDRGSFNDQVLSEAGFAGRTLGGMVWGKPLPQLRYYLAGASPTELGTGIEGVDLIARVVLEPIEQVSIGLNGMHKWSERFADGAELRVAALGADVNVEIGPLDLTLELDAVQNPNPPAVPDLMDPSRTPWALGFIGWAEYTFKVSKKWTIAPVVVFEWLDTDTEYSKDESIRAVVGLSWNYKRNALRIMPQVELTRPLGEADRRGAVAGETYYLLVSAQI